MLKNYKKFTSILLFVTILTLMSSFTFAEDTSKPDTGDTSFIIIATAMVFLMTPGLAFFYGGMVRRKNVLNTMMNSFTIIGLISIQWIILGYTLAFGTDTGSGLLGNFDFAGFNGITGTLTGTIPTGIFAMYQLMFAIITAAIIMGSFAERMKFPVLIVFILTLDNSSIRSLAHWV